MAKKPKTKTKALGVPVRKHGKLVDIPIRAGVVTALRSGRNGKVDFKSKAIVVGFAKADSFSRAYGRQAYYCVVEKGRAHIHTATSVDLYPVGRVKRIPAMCMRALAEHKGHRTTAHFRP